MSENLNDENKIGVVKISDEVISVISGLATSEIDGIEGMSSGIVGDLTQMLGGKKNLSKGVKVTVSEDSAIIDLFVVVKYGVIIPEVCEKVQDNVIKAVQTMTGLRVSAVNVYVQNVLLPKQEKEVKEEAQE